MTDTLDGFGGEDSFRGTVDWERFWRTADGDRRASADVGRHGKTELLVRFFEGVGVPDSFASVGCGPATVPFELDERYPGTDVVGYDAARSVVEQCRSRARREGADATFGVDRLPALETDRRFDVVYCYATLHYVADAEAAVRALYDRVRPGGHLVFNYPNDLTRAEYRHESEFDADFGERFGLVLAGENVLSAADIAAALGEEPRDYWAAVGADGEEWAGPANPCVYVPKPDAPR